MSKTGGGGAIGQNDTKNSGKLNYTEIKKLVDRRIVQNKKGILVGSEIQQLVKKWLDQRVKKDLNQATVEMKMKAMESAVQEINVPHLGHTPIVHEDSSMQIIVCQMGGCARPKVREFKIAALEKLVKKYNINLYVFMELNYNWSKVNSSPNLDSWFRNKVREV